MDYPEFSSQFLKALYLETEASGQQYHRADTLIEKYGLTPKPHWISRLADDWEHSNFKEVSRVLDGYDSWSFRISAQGSRKVEDEIEVVDLVQSVFGDSDKSEIEQISEQLAPASDRIVPLNHNSAEYQAVAAGLVEARVAIAQINITEEQEPARDDALAGLDAASALWKSTQLTFLQIKVGILLAAEIAQMFAAETAQKLKVSLLVEAIKASLKVIWEAI